jgi:hypothetical protein
LALCAFAFDKQLNNVDFPTLGNPTIPAFIILYLQAAVSGASFFFIIALKCKYTIKKCSIKIILN